jgi:hypothetical protein
VMNNPAAYSEKLTTSTALTPSDLKGLLSVGAEYRRNNFLLNRMILWIDGSYNLASKKFDVDLSTKQADAKYTAIEGTAGAGTRFITIYGFYVTILGGGGYSYGNLSLDYGALENPPLSVATNSATSSQKIDLSAPFARADFRLGYELSRQIVIEAGGSWRTLFYSGGVSSGLAVRVGVGFRI